MDFLYWEEDKLTQQQLDMEIKINLVEVASELADNATKDEMINREFIISDEERFTVDLDSGDLMYTEDAQDIYDRWYDYFYSKIEELEIK